MKEHLQLELFKPVRELYSNVNPNEAEDVDDDQFATEPGESYRRTETTREMMNRKVQETKGGTHDNPEPGYKGKQWVGGTFYSDMEARGVQKPVGYDSDLNMVTDGHHRVAAMNEINPDAEMAIPYTDDDDYPSYPSLDTVQSAYRNTSASMSSDRFWELRQNWLDHPDK